MSVDPIFLSRNERLRDIEQTEKRLFDSHFSARDGREKKFVTFPYPYMNGRLHAGHAYQLSKVDFIARYYDSMGYNVLFPFGMHASGMPIVACADKIREETSRNEIGFQSQILTSMGIPKEEIIKFKDPEHWVRYFSQKCTEDINDFGIMYDKRRSFYTTQMNPYYDSFVTWQFNRLIKKSYIKKGKRFVIYSRKDSQPCADHDRAKGEGVEPIEFALKMFPTSFGKLIVVGNDKMEGDQITMIHIDSTKTFVQFTNGVEKYVTGHWSFQNLSCQYENLHMIEELSNEDLQQIIEELSQTVAVCHSNVPFGTNSVESISQCIPDQPITYKSFQINDILSEKIPSEQVYFNKYLEPRSEVVSRTGDKCVVALIDQWFIDYSDQTIKDKLTKFVEEEFECFDGGVKKQFLESIEWLQEWPCNRNFGLGTFLPGTHDVIDSLSDSTIYMAYYTVSHLIESIPKEMLCDELWDCIFFGKSDNPLVFDNFSAYSELINEMNQEFNYWYPVDLRVSGKDLIANHLTMCMFNHLMIFSDTKYLPRKMLIGGHLLLEGNKMSKSTGNFFTLKDGVDKYGIDIFRFVLANNDGIKDGNFDTKEAICAVNKLMGEMEFILKELENSKGPPTTFDLFDQAYNDDIDRIEFNVQDAYENGKFRYVIQCVNDLINARLSYMKYKAKYLSEPSNILFQKSFKLFARIIEPICPCYGASIRKKISLSKQDWWTKSIYTPTSSNYLKDLLEDVIGFVNKSISKSVKSKQPYSSIDVYFVKEFQSAELQIISYVKEFDSKEIFSEYMKGIQIEGLAYGQIKKFGSFIKDKFDKYGRSFDEYAKDVKQIELIETTIKKMFSSEQKVFVKCVESSKDTLFTIFPSLPVVKLVC